LKTPDFDRLRGCEEFSISSYCPAHHGCGTLEWEINHAAKRMKTMGRRPGVIPLLIAGLCGTPILSNAAPVVYDFTGTVISSAGAYSSAKVGDLVTGTFTIDFAYADTGSTPLASASSPPPAELFETTYGGSTYGKGPAPGVVFSTVAHVDSITYTTAVPGPFYTTSVVEGLDDDGTPSYNGGEEAEQSANANVTYSGFQFMTNAPGGAYTADGLPRYIDPIHASGDFGAEGPGPSNAAQVIFDLDTLTRVTSSVPEAPTVWMLLAGVAAVAFIAHKQRGRAKRFEVTQGIRPLIPILIRAGSRGSHTLPKISSHP